jgi:hypothetical protein
VGLSTIGLSASGIFVERKFSVSPEQAWDLLTDTAQWPKWGPSVKGVFCDQRVIRCGSRGRVRLPVGVTLPFVVTDYEYLKYWHWKVAGVSATGHRLIPTGSGGCRIRFEMPVYWMPYVIVCRIALSRIAAILAQ